MDRNSLPASTECTTANVPEFNKLLSDGGGQLRSVEFDTVGRVVETDSDGSADGGATGIEVTGGDTMLELAGVDDLRTVEVRTTGVIEPPFDGGHLRVVVQELTPRRD